MSLLGWARGVGASPGWDDVGAKRRESRSPFGSARVRRRCAAPVRGSPETEELLTARRASCHPPIVVLGGPMGYSIGRTMTDGHDRSSGPHAQSAACSRRARAPCRLPQGCSGSQAADTRRSTATTVDSEEIDESVLALLHLTLPDDARTGKGMDRDGLGCLRIVHGRSASGGPPRSLTRACARRSAALGESSPGSVVGSKAP